MSQISIFDGNEKFKIDKPIRLIELFAGYGSQNISLKYLGANFESWHICEWAVKSIQAYKDIHCGSDKTDYSSALSFEELIEFLFQKGISADYNKPMTKDQIKRMGESKCREVYNNIVATKNIVNIAKAKATDFEIVDTDNYCYVMTYSFPCQDLSKAGKGKGMAKNSGTRSGMLWQVERILDECENLPQVLLMENVPDVIGSKNRKDFAKWLEKLESLGYRCYWQVLNGKNYGIPQNRERCFMVSLLGDYYYEFPDSIKLSLRLKDMLEENVDEKYYLSGQTINYFTLHSEDMKAKGNGFRFAPTDGDCVAKTVTTRAGGRMDYNFIKCEQVAQIEGTFESTGRIYSTEGLSPTITTCGGGNSEPKILENEPLIIKEATAKGYAEDYDGDSINLEHPNSKTRRGRVGKQCAQTLTTSCNQAAVEHNKIRKLTPKECWRLMGVNDEDFEKVAKNQSNSSLYHLAGDSIITNVLMAIFQKML